MGEMTQWQHARVFEKGGLLDQLRPLGVAEEKEIEHLCQEEIAAWRARPTMVVESSLQEPLRHARNAIREHLVLNESNRWRNPKTKKDEHIALKYLNFSLDEWQRINADSEDRFARRLREQQRIDDPDAIVRLSEDLLRQQEWYHLALGVTINTGRRLTEVLKTGVFSPKTTYTLWFKGQLKTKEYDLEAYEIPTLVPVDLVIAAVDRLRQLQDCAQMSNDAVSQRFGPVMRQMADQLLSPLIPKRDPDQNIYTHLSRSIYGRLCVLYHCPPAVFDVHYMAHILGHYWYFREQDERKRANLDSTLHYMDYVIGDGRGNLDGRRGIWLGVKPGVEVLDAFRKEWQDMTEPSVERTSRSSKTKGPEGEQHPVAPKKRSILNCLPQQKTLFDDEMRRRRLAHQHELVGALLNEAAWYRQMEALLAPLSDAFQTSTPLETLRALVAASEHEQQDVAVSTHLQQRWGISLEQIDRLFEKAIEEGYEKPLQHFEGTLEKRESYKAGALKRAQKYQQTDFTSLPYSQLEHIRTPEAAQERVRRIVLTIMRHNEHAQPRDRWYINAGLVYQLKTIRHEVINAYLKEHDEEITLHHRQLGIEPRYNRKMESVREMIALPEEPL
jgi:telomere resolvase